MNRPPKAAAGHIQLREDFKQELLTALAAIRREPATEDSPQAAQDCCPGASVELGRKQALSVVSATSCRCHKFDDKHLHVTILCPCARATTTDRATQTDRIPRDDNQRCSSRAVGTVAEQLQASNQWWFNRTRTNQLAASVPNGTFMNPLQQSGTGNGAKACKAEAESSMEYISESQWSPSHLVTSSYENPRLSRAERRRRVHEALARVRDTLFEALRDTPRAMAATSRTGIFETVFPSVPTSPSPPPPTAQPLPSISRVETSGDSSAIMNSTLDSIADEGEGIDARSDARRMIISEEMTTIFAHIESRWTEMCDQIRMDLNSRYDQFLEDCRTCLRIEQGSCERDQLRHEMTDARCELIAEMKDEFRAACEAFEEWRERYLQMELQTSCTSLHQGDRFRVLAAVLRLEILDSLPDLATRTRERAAALWKELVELWGPNVDALFNEEL